MRIFTGSIWRVLILAAGVWAALVMRYSPILSPKLQIPVAVLISLLCLVAIFRPRRYAAPLFVALLIVVVAWVRLSPSNDRDWQRDLSKLAWSERNGDEVTIHNIRDFLYRTETDFDERYVTKTVKLSELSSLDLFASYWSGKSIAHIFISFGFADRDYIAFSIEVRKTKEQAYSTVEGFFRNYELIYVVAEERDVVGLRTIYRQPNEQVYLLRLKYFKDNAIKLFLKYLENMNELVKHPQFYNTLTTNCTTQVLLNAQNAGGSRRFKYDWRLLLSGYAPEYFQKMGNLDDGFPLEVLMQKGLVNSRAQDVSNVENFSKSIREGVPRPAVFTAAPQ